MYNKNQLCLHAILEAIEKIEVFISQIGNSDEFMNDLKSFDAVMMNFIIIGEEVSKLDETFKLNHAEIDWYKVKAFRNIVVHEYFGINAEEVWQIIRNRLPELKKKVLGILNKS